MTERFFHFKCLVKKLNIIINSAIHVLMYDDNGVETYNLVKMAISQNSIENNLKIIMHGNFNEFICSGFRETTSKKTIQILECLIDKPELADKLEINYDRILKKMYQLYLETENKSIESNLLYAFYNFATSGNPQF